MFNERRKRMPVPRRGFTLVELLVAGVIAAFVIGSISFSMAQIGRSRATSKMRFDAHLRADVALSNLRRDIITVTRTDDLFYSHVLLYDDAVRVGQEVFDRDELLVYNTRLRPLRDISFNGEGFEYETQVRIIEDDFGPVLWQRRDPLPDEYEFAGGMATPLVEGVLGLSIQAFDGELWYEQWDSDIDGLPQAIRITVTTAADGGKYVESAYGWGRRKIETVRGYNTPRAILRTVVPIDRVLVPRDQFPSEEDENAEGTDLDGDGIPDDVPTDGGDGSGIPTGGGRPGGGPGNGPGGPPDGGPGGDPGTGPRPNPGRPGSIGRPGTSIGGPRPSQSPGGSQ